MDASYDGPRLPDDVTSVKPDFIVALMDRFKRGKLLHRKYVIQILLALKSMFEKLPSLLRVSLPSDDPDAHFTVCGDTHGQFYDVCNIFSINGLPSETNPYLFNGDFVDRGSFSFEVVMTLFAMKLVYPQHVHLLRGNHESKNMNKIYGFEGEVKHKYDETVMQLFTEVFNWLPLAAVIEDRVLVVHGGLFSEENVTLDGIAKIDRNREPPESGLMSDLMWSDPQPFAGRGPSKRGIGLSFGPDVTKAFLEYNNLGGCHSFSFLFQRCDVKTANTRCCWHFFACRVAGALARGQGRGLPGRARRQVHHRVQRAELLRSDGQQGRVHSLREGHEAPVHPVCRRGTLPYSSYDREVDLAWHPAMTDAKTTLRVAFLNTGASADSPHGIRWQHGRHVRLSAWRRSQRTAAVMPLVTPRNDGRKSFLRWSRSKVCTCNARTLT